MFLEFGGEAGLLATAAFDRCDDDDFNEDGVCADDDDDDDAATEADGEEAAALETLGEPAFLGDLPRGLFDSGVASFAFDGDADSTA